MRAFKLLFNDTDHICFGDHKAIDVKKQPETASAEFFCINPLAARVDYVKQPDGAIKAFYGKGRRADLNVTKFQTFLFEMDNTPLELQMQYIKSCGFPWATITYSGGKSYHALLSLTEPLNTKPHTQEGIEAYKRTWKQLAHVLAARIGQPVKILDSSTQNPSRLSRMPESMRGDKVQTLEFVGRLCKPAELADLLKEAPDFAPTMYEPRTERTAKDESDLKLFMPAPLLERLKFPSTWARGEAGNYPELLKLILWLIDSTGASKETAVQFLDKYTFPTLMRRGYPNEKCMKAVNDAYTMKGRS